MRYVDLLREQIAHATADRLPVLGVADTLSTAINVVWDTYIQLRDRFRDRDEQVEVHAKCKSLCLWLLAVQHSFLDVVYYGLAHAHQDRLYDLMRLRFCTVDYLLKMQAGFLGDHLSQKNLRHILLIDEFGETERFKISAILTSEVEGAVLAGDPNQSVPEDKRKRKSTDDQKPSGWLLKSRRVKWHTFSESRRIAPPLSLYIPTMFKELETFTSSRPPADRTLLLPVWFSVHEYDL